MDAALLNIKDICLVAHMAFYTYTGRIQRIQVWDLAAIKTSTPTQRCLLSAQSSLSETGRAIRILHSILLSCWQLFTRCPYTYTNTLHHPFPVRVNGPQLTNPLTLTSLEHPFLRSPTFLRKAHYMLCLITDTWISAWSRRQEMGGWRARISAVRLCFTVSV